MLNVLCVLSLFVGFIAFVYALLHDAGHPQRVSVPTEDEYAEDDWEVLAEGDWDRMSEEQRGYLGWLYLEFCDEFCDEDREEDCEEEGYEEDF